MSLGVGFKGLTLHLVRSLCFMLAIEDMDSPLPTPYLKPALAPPGTTAQMKFPPVLLAMVFFACVWVE